MTQKIQCYPPPLNQKIPKGSYCGKLVCNIHRILVRGKVIHLYFPKGDCCDMNGAIHIARMLHSQVNAIVTYSGHEVDTMYYRGSGTQWSAHRP